MRKSLQRIAAAVTTVATVGTMLLTVAPAHAAAITSMKDTLSRLKTSTVAYHKIEFTLPSVASGTLTILLDSGFSGETATSVTGTCGSGTIVGFAADSTTGSFTANLVSCSGAVVINASSTGTTGFSATNPGTGGSKTIRIYAGGAGHVSQATADAAATHKGNMAVAITTDDQISVTAQVDPSITFTVGATTTACSTSAPSAGGTVALGIIPTSSTVISSKGSSTNNAGAAFTVSHICTHVSTNAASGYVVSVVSLNGALVSTSVTADKIPNTAITGPAFDQVVTAGTPSYGLCFGSDGGDTGHTTTTPDGNNAAATSPYDGTCTSSTTSAAESAAAMTTGGATNTSALSNQVMSASGFVQNGFATLYIKAAAGVTSEAHTDYADTLTFLATGTF